MSALPVRGTGKPPGAPFCLPPIFLFTSRSKVLYRIHEPESRGCQIRMKGTGDFNAGQFGPKAKEPWEMTREEYAAVSRPFLKVTKPAKGLDTEWGKRQRLAAAKNRRFLRREWRRQGLSDARIRGRFRSNKALDLHRGYVEKAFSEGKPVPAKVLRDYPDLIPHTGKRRPTR